VKLSSGLSAQADRLVEEVERRVQQAYVPMSLTGRGQTASFPMFLMNYIARFHPLDSGFLLKVRKNRQILTTFRQFKTYISGIPNRIHDKFPV